MINAAFHERRDWRYCCVIQHHRPPVGSCQTIKQISSIATSTLCVFPLFDQLVPILQTAQEGICKVFWF
ncbi:MAG TPA: hypothetical protein VGE93_09715 [Bryobacteraceae bacterium]